MQPKSALRASLKLVIECCALYLLSILALLFGVYSAMQSPLLGGQGVAADLPLWSVMHLYDLALVGVIGFLFSRPERREDGYYVAMAAVALTMDPTLFVHRFYSYDLDYGLRLGGLGMGLAMVKMLTLAWVCRVPLSRRNLVSLGLVFGVIYLGPIAFHLPGAPVGGGWFGVVAYGLLCWTPLVLALTSPGQEEMDFDPVDATEAASVRAAEFRWVALFLPLVGFGLHFWQMSGLYDLPLGWMHLGPAALALAVLVHRLDPEDEVASQTAFHLAAIFSLVTSVAPTGQWTLAAEVFPITPLRLTLLAQAGIAGYLALRYRVKSLEVHALVAGALFLAGGTPAEIATHMAGPYGWLLFTGAAALATRRNPEYVPAACTWTGAAGTVACLVTGQPFSLLFLHLAGVGVVGLMHAFEGEAEERGALATGVILLLLGHSGAELFHRGVEVHEVVRMGAEGLLVAVGAWCTPFWRYRAPATIGLGGGLLRFLPVDWLVEHEAVLGLVSSFGLLGAGFWVSLNKGDLLERLEEPEEAAAGAAAEAA